MRRSFESHACLSSPVARPPAARAVRRHPPCLAPPECRSRVESSGDAERGSFLSVCGGGGGHRGEGQESDEGPARRAVAHAATSPRLHLLRFRNRGNRCAGGHGWPCVLLDALRVRRRKESRVCFRCATSAARYAPRHAGTGTHSIDTHRGSRRGPGPDRSREEGTIGGSTGACTRHKRDSHRRRPPRRDEGNWQRGAEQTFEK
mmetsp:Transcript_109787/g.319372  ORF Transcript_109787/g.319372 Transcript_109787/m.319372 type:complete len:204 (+) Transcript_109787:396-1007(+)